jgi:hypothetical protein
MRAILAIAIALGVTAATSPADGQHSPEAQAKLDTLLGGRVPGEARRCVGANVVTSPIGIDDRTLLFGDGPRIWRTELRASMECGKMSKQARIHTESAANRICSGQQLEFSDGGIQGACVFGDFVPYQKP